MNGEGAFGFVQIPGIDSAIVRRSLVCGVATQDESVLIERLVHRAVSDDTRLRRRKRLRDPWLSTRDRLHVLTRHAVDVVGRRVPGRILDLYPIFNGRHSGLLDQLLQNLDVTMLKASDLEHLRLNARPAHVNLLLF